MVSRPSLKEACDLPKAQGAVVIKHDDVNGSAAASNLELCPQKHGSSCCIHKDTMLPASIPVQNVHKDLGYG